MLRSANLRTVLSKSQNANPLNGEPETNFNAEWLLKVTQGHVFRCLWGAVNGLYIVAYICPWMWRFRRYSWRKKRINRHFDDSTLIWRPLFLANLREYPHKSVLTLLETRIPKLWQYMGRPSSANFRSVLPSHKRQPISCRLPSPKQILIKMAIQDQSRSYISVFLKSHSWTTWHNIISVALDVKLRKI